MSDKAKLKRYDGTVFTEVYPQTTHDQIVASGTPSSSTFLRGDGVWAAPAVDKADLKFLYIYGKAQSAITKGQAVQFAGVQGDHILMKPAVPGEINANPDYFIGIAEETLSTNAFGYILTQGELVGVNTNAYTAGDVLWFASAGGTNGALTATEPTGSNARIQVASVNRTNADGILLVRVNFVGTEIEDIVASGTASSTTFLRGDGQWAVPSGVDNYVNITGDTMTGPLTYTTLVGPGTETRDKIRVWSSANYTIGMQSGYNFGALANDFAMSFQMNDSNTRGFWWGDTAHNNAQGAMSLSTQGRLTVAEGIRVGYGQTDTTVPGTGLDVNGNIKVSGDNRYMTFGTPGAGTTTGARFLSIEGNTDTGGEGSSRIFFAEHNSTTAQMDSYGMSLGYRGGDTSIVGASGNTWTGLTQIGNGQWGMWGHNGNATGSLIMSGDRAATYVRFQSRVELTSNAYIEYNATNDSIDFFFN
jgi:hypothetical protein